MTADEQSMRQVLELARAGIGLVSPNPAVGAVVVDASGNEAGAGTHTYDGVKHAEILALEQAGGRARGGTLYLNLEPCSHQGRTGPCAESVVAAGIQRVVCSMQDPNPLVAGQGFATLRAAGIRVEIGAFEAEAKKLNESFAKYIRHRIPLVTLKGAMTLDGKIAPPPSGTRHPTDVAAGGSTGGWITGEIARQHVHQLRHQHDAIMAGVGTVIADDPLLTDRSGLARRRPLLRVILDSWLRLPQASRLVKTAKDDVLVLCSSADESKQREIEKLGVRVERIAPMPDGRPDLADVMRHLGKHEITSLLIEGGATLNWSALSSGVVDKLFLYYAPKILGEGSVPFTASQGAGIHHGAIQARHLQLHQFGEDFAVEGYLRDPYQG
ncbi:MAG: bifunctional diaminohydroxyphosphoribosylaminopyrimidine deaminase/5-amino-6-(5-phosphoribosylamino)uracil reductase RibD [Acidobacteriia bacterium]|nr:bifunctional diaminohydroxyphosphoribosylaminopyrimidine deaminase/5-amino-6-(5-phosphoribosylamino)uracil reductase RibD [Terriglobia bacterium]